MAREIPQEVWANIPGYNGVYQVSTHGRVRRVTLNGKTINRLLKPQKYFKGKQGLRGSQHYRVDLSYNGKLSAHSVQKLMYQSFFGPVEEGKYVVLKYPELGLCLENLEISDVQYTLNNREIRYCSKGHPLLSTDDYYESIFKRTGEKRCKICHRAIVEDQRRRGVIS